VFREQVCQEHAEVEAACEDGDDHEQDGGHKVGVGWPGTRGVLCPLVAEVGKTLEDGDGDGEEGC